MTNQFIDAFNRRDVDGLLSMMNPAVEFHPTALVGTRRRYDGHEGVRRWFGEVDSSQMQHQVRVREVRPTEDGFVLLSEVLLDGKLVSPSAMIARLGADGKIVEARAFLTDEELLVHLGVIDDSEEGKSK
jgi:ketosteroid isomerase-like protein